MVLITKKLRFCQLFVLGKIHQDKVFGNLLVSKLNKLKQAFLDNRNVDLTKPQNWQFPKRLDNIFGQKVEVFRPLCSSEKDGEKYFAGMKQKPFETIRTSVYEERKICFFSKEVSPSFTSTLIFIQNRPRKSISGRSS